MYLCVCVKIYYFRTFKGCEKMAEQKKTPTKKTQQVTKKAPPKSAQKPKSSKPAPKKSAAKSSKRAPKTKHPSEKFIHQILPFILVAIALLLEVCFILASITGDKHVGIAGVFLKNVFLGLFGFCAFIMPVMLVNLALNWRKFIESGVIKAKIFFTVLFLTSLAGVIHIFVKESINPELAKFINPVEIYNYSTSHLFSSGLIGGVFCEGIYFLFKAVGTTIIMITLSIACLIFSIGISPRYLGNVMRSKWSIMVYKQKEKNAIRKEERAEQKRIEREERAEEKARLEAEEEMMRLAEKQIEDERIAEAERRAIEREEKEKSDREKFGEMRFVDPAPKFYDEPAIQNVNFEAEEPEEFIDDGRINVASVFKNPPKEYDPKNDMVEEEPVIEEQKEVEQIKLDLPAKPKKVKKEEDLSVDMKEITDIETVPDEGEDSTVPENVIREYVRPDVSLLKNYKNDDNEKAAHEEIRANATALMETLKSFKVNIKVSLLCEGSTVNSLEHLVLFVASPVCTCA